MTKKKAKKSAEAELADFFTGDNEVKISEIKSSEIKDKLKDAEVKETEREKESKETGKEVIKDREEKKKDTGKKKVVAAILTGERVITESSDESREFYNQSRFGTLADDGKVELSLLEALYLMEKGRLVVKSEAGKVLNFESYFKRAQAVEPNFWIRYVVLKDIRNRGYIIKTALKFGADFRVYERGVKPGEDHAKWIVFPVHEASVFTWHEFSAKNRVAHSTKKRLLLGVVDDENDVTYYEVKWMRP